MKSLLDSGRRGQDKMLKEKQKKEKPMAWVKKKKKNNHSFKEYSIQTATKKKTPTDKRRLEMNRFSRRYILIFALP